MNKGQKTVALIASAAFFLAIFLYGVLHFNGYSVNLFSNAPADAAIAALLVVCAQFLVRTAAGHPDFIFYALSFVPASCLWLSLCAGGAVLPYIVVFVVFLLAVTALRKAGVRNVLPHLIFFCIILAALFVWMGCRDRLVWLAFILSAAGIFIPESSLPESRMTTRWWLGSCILLVLASMLPPIVKLLEIS